MRKYEQEIYENILECEMMWGGRINKISINNNTAEFLRKEFIDELITISYTLPLKAIFGLEIVINDNLKDGEFLISLEMISDKDYGFVNILEKAYKFRIDFLKEGENV